MIDKLNVKGELVITLYDGDGNIKKRLEVNNLVVTTGKEILISRLWSSSVSPSHAAIGSNNANAAVGDTGLATETAGTRRVFDNTIGSGTSVTYNIVWPAGVGTGVVREAGLFTAVTAGILFARTTFSDIPKAAADILEINWTIKIN